MKDPLYKFLVSGDFPPNNLYHIEISKLESLGYKRREFIHIPRSKELPRSQEGDLLCATNKNRDLWIRLDERSAKTIDPAKFLVYYN